MQIHKFGGASISTVERIRNLPEMIRLFDAEKNLIVISALGKTTNALEDIALLYYQGNQEESLAKLNQLRDLHFRMAEDLLHTEKTECLEILAEYFSQLEENLSFCISFEYNFYYDQLISFGEMFSSTLVSHFLRESGIPNLSVDAKEYLTTNDHFREAGILWKETEEQLQQELLPVFQHTDLIITQGFIGSTLTHEAVTLGREGSDFSAAVFASGLNAERVTIWKDVPGVMNGDPRQFKEAVVIPHMSYKEALEMTYYGAQVIHPKTIKPLQNKSIPLFVRSFLNVREPGTQIDHYEIPPTVPIIVYKTNQVLFNFQTKDYAFIEGKPSKAIHKVLSDARIKANLTQNTAISMLVCADDIPEKTEKVLQATPEFSVLLTSGLTLLTIRYYSDQIREKLLSGKKLLLEQRTTDTLHVLFKE